MNTPSKTLFDSYGERCLEEPCLDTPRHGFFKRKRKNRQYVVFSGITQTGLKESPVQQHYNDMLPTPETARHKSIENEKPKQHLSIEVLPDTKDGTPAKRRCLKYHKMTDKNF